MGNLGFEVGDKLRLSLGTRRTGEDESVTFKEFDYQVASSGLVAVSDSNARTNKGGLAAELAKKTGAVDDSDGAIDLLTWTAKTVTLPINFTEETLFLSQYRVAKQVQSKGKKNTLKDAMKTEEDYILEKIKLEVEVRDSDFIRLASEGQLESCFVQIYLDKSSVLDLLMARDLADTA